MIIVMREGAGRDSVDRVMNKIGQDGLKPVPLVGVERTVIAVIGDERKMFAETFSAMPDVEKVMPVLRPYKLAARESHPKPSVISVRGVPIGGPECVVAAGPCSVESEAQIVETARRARAAGARLLRGGAFKPRTGPYDFQGLRAEGLRYLAAARAETGLPVVTEVVDPRDVGLVAEYADMFQIGTRNMQNYLLLKEVGQTRLPVLLKRGMQARYTEFLLAAEYVMAEGNPNVVLCERGIRTFETYTRNSLDLNAVPVIRELSHLPIMVDPSHGTGRRSLVAAMSLAAVACGADGVLLEVHPQPENALTDADQTISCDELATLMPRLRAVAAAVGRTVGA